MVRMPKSGKPTEVVVQLLREHGIFSPAELARVSGLGKATISRAVKELRDAGVVVEAMSATPVVNQNAGRPATALRLNPETGLCIGVAFGPRHIGVVLSDVAHTVISHQIQPMALDYLPAVGVSGAKSLMDKVFAENGRSPDNLLGIGVAVGAPIDIRNGQVIRSSLIPSWSGVAVKDLFQKELDVPVFVDNATNCMAIAELMWGKARGRRNVVYILLDQGLGGALVVNGEIVRGHAGGAGEIGHITYDRHGPICRCGNRGCYELYASIPALLRQLAAAHGDTITLEGMLSLAVGGDLGVKRSIQDVGQTVGELAAFVANVANPELIVIGGDLAQAGEDLIEAIRGSFGRHALMAGRTDADGETEISLGIDRASPELGAVGLVLKSTGTEQSGRTGVDPSWLRNRPFPAPPVRWPSSSKTSRGK